MNASFPVIDMKATGLNIKKARERRGVSVKELQDFLGFDAPQAIYKWQRGESLPSFDNMYAITCYLNVSIDEILVGNREDFLFDKGEGRLEHLCYYLTDVGIKVIIKHGWTSMFIVPGTNI